MVIRLEDIFLMVGSIKDLPPIPISIFLKPSMRGVL